MTNAELKRLSELLLKALSDDSVSGIRPPGTRGKRYGTDISRALAGVEEALAARGVPIER